jgi:hypothetical protein
MTDKEMLEYAAKAAGIELWHEDVFTNGLTQKVSENGILQWNPLTDDGDAFKLMVQLRLGTLFPTEIGRDRVDVKGHTESLALNDPLAATRRAIVRTAAEIGRSMK